MPLHTVKVHQPLPENRPIRIEVRPPPPSAMRIRNRGNTITEENATAHVLNTNQPNWLEKEGITVDENFEDRARRRKGLPPLPKNVQGSKETQKTRKGRRSGRSRRGRRYSRRHL